MANELDRHVKTALDETRLLILGVQVLLGFAFQAFFQNGFAKLPSSSQSVCVIGLFLVIASTGALLIPTMEHRLVESGASSRRLLDTTGFFAGLGLAPLTASLGLFAYVVIERHFGTTAAISAGLMLSGVALFAWFGLELLIGSSKGVRAMENSATPLSTKIDQLLTEARLIIPGAQALFGFQFIAMLTAGFDMLSQEAKLIHACGLCLIAANVILLMTPAALHRLSFDGEDSNEFLRIGSAFVIAAPLFLAAGIAAETYVVLLKTFQTERWAIAGAGIALTALITFWYAIPLALRRARAKHASPPPRNSLVTGG